MNRANAATEDEPQSIPDLGGGFSGFLAYGLWHVYQHFPFEETRQSRHSLKPIETSLVDSTWDWLKNRSDGGHIATPLC